MNFCIIAKIVSNHVPVAFFFRTWLCHLHLKRDARSLVDDNLNVATEIGVPGEWIQTAYRGHTREWSSMTRRVSISGWRRMAH